MTEQTGYRESESVSAEVVLRRKEVAMLLYMDVDVPFAITAGLRLRGIDVLTAQEDGTSDLDDDVLLDRVTALGRIIFTRDVDFLAHARERQRTGRLFRELSTLINSRHLSGKAWPIWN